MPCCLHREREGTSCDSCHRRGEATRQEPCAAAARAAEDQAACSPYGLSRLAPVPPKEVPVAAGTPWWQPAGWSPGAGGESPLLSA